MKKWHLFIGIILRIAFYSVKLIINALVHPFVHCNYHLHVVLNIFITLQVKCIAYSYFLFLPNITYIFGKE